MTADRVWTEPALVRTYLEGVRGAIPLANESIDVMLRAIGPRVNSFLDLGCGDGVLAVAIADRFPNAEAVLVDFSEPMLEAARRRFLDAIFADYGSPDWLSKVRGPFDAIVSGFSIHHQPDSRKKQLYGEIFNLLTPGGMFVNIEHVASASRWLEGLSDDLFIDALHRYDATVPRAEVAERYHSRPDKSANILAPVGRQCEWLSEIGFQDVDCYLKIFEIAVFGGRRP